MFYLMWGRGKGGSIFEEQGWQEGHPGFGNNQNIRRTTFDLKKTQTC
jgi:hypothetical protein